MLGEQIIPDEQGKIVGVRALPGEAGGPNRLEITFQSQGTILGIGFQNTGTVVATPRVEGVLAAKGHGVAVTQDGEATSWAYEGLARPSGPGMSGTFRGQVLFQAHGPKLARLNGMCVMVEASVDENQVMRAQLWEWK